MFRVRRKASWLMWTSWVQLYPEYRNGINSQCLNRVILITRQVFRDLRICDTLAERLVSDADHSWRGCPCGWGYFEDLCDRETGLRKTQLEGLADCAASALATRCVNTAEWQTVLPRRVGDEKSKERYISRLLGNRLIDPFAVMQGFIPEIAESLGDQGKTLVLMMDQSKIRDGFECLMISLRLGERALPVSWAVEATQGPIGFSVQKKLLEQVKMLLPPGINVLLAADRFYGTAALIGWCQRQGWDYRIRLKDNNILHHEGGQITTGEAARAGLAQLLNARFNEQEVTTHIGILHEKGHPEPWIIAMGQSPSKARVLDYGMRWGIEALFSDFKSRGFNITKAQLSQTDRIDRLILILTIALYWAISTGMKPEAKRNQTKKEARSLISFFKKGLRYLLNAALTLASIPKLWAYLKLVGW